MSADADRLKWKFWTPNELVAVVKSQLRSDSLAFEALEELRLRALHAPFPLAVSSVGGPEEQT